MSFELIFFDNRNGYGHYSSKLKIIGWNYSLLKSKQGDKKSLCCTWYTSPRRVIPLSHNPCKTTCTSLVRTDKRQHLGIPTMQSFSSQWMKENLSLYDKSATMHPPNFVWKEKIIYSSLTSNECFGIILIQQFTRWQNRWYQGLRAPCSSQGELTPLLVPIKSIEGCTDAGKKMTPYFCAWFIYLLRLS